MSYRSPAVHRTPTDAACTASASPRWSPDGSRDRLHPRRSDMDSWTLRGGTLTADHSHLDRRRRSGLVTGRPLAWRFASDVLSRMSATTPATRNGGRKAAAQSKVKAHVAERLLYRHWKTWKDGLRSHVFIVSAAGGSARDLTPGDYDAPPFSLGGPTDYAFAPDSKELAYAEQPRQGRSHFHEWRHLGRRRSMAAMEALLRTSPKRIMAMTARLSSRPMAALSPTVRK